MNRIGFGILAGTITGLIDVVPMVVKKLPLEADLSALAMWIAVGFFLSTSTIKLPGAIKGIIFAFMILAPTAIIIGFKEPTNLIPIGVMTFILGICLGFLIERIGIQKRHR
jgi:uncharacterized membrane protein